MKRILCIILCLLLLAGCGSNAASYENEDFPLVVVDGEAVPSGASLENTASGAGYLTYASQALPAGIERVTAQCKAGDRLYVGGLTRDGAALAWTDLDGTEQPLALPEEIEYISALCPTADGFALLGGSLPEYYENWHGDSLRVAEPEGAMWIVLYDQSSEETGSIALQEAYTSAFLQILAAEDGFYLLSEGKIIQTGSDGAELGRWTPPEDSYFLGVAQCEGELYVLSMSFFPDVPNQILKLDAGNLEPQLELPESTLFGFGQADDGTLLLSYTAEDKKELAALDLETGQLTGLYDWTLLGGVVSADWISQWDQGYVFFSNGDKIEQLRWTSGVRPERITLQMAVTGFNNITQLVQEFNFSQDVYTIEITTYDDDTGDKTLDLLRTELLAGNTPDLYCFCSGGSIGGVYTGGVDLAKFGMDLLPWLDSDSEFDREDFVPNLLAGMERSGGLYTLPLAFDIVTCVAPEELVAESGITIEELEAVRERAGDGWVTFDSWNDASNLLGLTMPFCLGAYVDRDTGTCSFDSQGFQDYLTWCKTWAGGGVVTVGDAVVSGYDPDEKPILSMRYVTSSWEVVSLAHSAQYRGYSGYTYAGIPVEEGIGSVFETCAELGISAATAYPEGAWSFLHYCLTRQSDITELMYGLPVLQPVIDSQVAWYQSGEAMGYDGSPEVAEQKNVDRFYELLNNTTVIGGEDTVLEEIIKAEAELFFSGARTAAETASAIQSRASLYVMEQYG